MSTSIESGAGADIINCLIRYNINTLDNTLDNSLTNQLSSSHLTAIQNRVSNTLVTKEPKNPIKSRFIIN